MVGVCFIVSSVMINHRTRAKFNSAFSAALAFAVPYKASGLRHALFRVRLRPLLAGASFFTQLPFGTDMFLEAPLSRLPSQVHDPVNRYSPFKQHSCTVYCIADRIKPGYYPQPGRHDLIRLKRTACEK